MVWIFFNGADGLIHGKGHDYEFNQVSDRGIVLLPVVSSFLSVNFKLCLIFSQSLFSMGQHPVEASGL